MPAKILIIAGEESGDAHAAHLCRAVREMAPDAEIEAWGGKELERVGVRVHENIVDHAVMGLWPVLARLPYFIKLYFRIVRYIDQWQPDVVIPVDYPGLNLRIAKRAKRSGFRVLFYVSPQVWAWWRSRVRRIGRCVTKILVLFPFEERFYREHGIDVEYVGHPLFDKFLEVADCGSLTKQLALEPNSRVIGLLPGSRRHEIKRLLPLVLDVAKCLHTEDPSLRFVLAAANDRFAAIAREAARELDLEVDVVTGQAHQVMQCARVVVVASGTATLECLYFQVPMVIVYRVSLMSYLLAKLLLATAHIGLANIIAGKRIVPELLEWRHRPAVVADALRALIADGSARAECLAELRRARERMGEAGASQRAAAAALAMVTGPN